MRKYEGLSDFFRNVTEDEKREVYLEVIKRSTIEQNKTLDKAKEEQFDEDSATQTSNTSTERLNQSLNTNEQDC